jgi:hypothetical protein
MMNSTATPTVMQLGVCGLSEQSGRALTDQQGLPLAEVQLRIASVVRRTNAPPYPLLSGSPQQYSRQLP